MDRLELVHQREGRPRLRLQLPLVVVAVLQIDSVAVLAVVEQLVVVLTQKSLD